MKRIANCVLPVLGLIWMSVHFGCQGPTLVTGPGPSSSGPVNGMLYYLPIGKITIKGEYAQPEGTPKAKAATTETATPRELTITLTAEVEADEGAGVYYVTPQSNYIYEDEVRVAVNAKHLLSTGNVTTEDKTAEIAGALASLARAGLGFAKTEALENQRPFNFTFHPSNSTEVNSVTAKLRERGIGLKVTMDSKDVKGICVIPNEEVKKLAQEIGRSGLVFRPAASYKIQLTSPVGSGSDVDNTQQLLLPDPTSLYAIEYRRMAFVKKVKNIGFVDGMLTDYHQKVPSPVLGFIGIPKAIVDALVPIPGAAPQAGSASASGTTPPKN